MVNHVTDSGGNIKGVRLLEYTSSKEDMDWAHSGIVATLALDETILSVQQRVEDAGFTNVEVTPMGGDKVFLRCRNNEDIMHVFKEAIHFFGMLFSVVHRWTMSDALYERGAWVRVYGTPIHAWNINFFKLCASKCGRFIRVGDCTSDKGRIDFPRILISTTSVEVLNKSMVMLVDGSKCSIKLVEEWGCHLGEDAFLMEEIVEHRASNVDDDLEREIGEDFYDEDGDVDLLVEDMHQEWREHEAKATADNNNNNEDVERPVQPAVAANTTAVVHIIKSSILAPNASTKHCPIFPETCPLPKTDASKSTNGTGDNRKRKKKAVGFFKQSTRNLKRLARMLEKDRREILRILKKRAIKRGARSLARSIKYKGAVNSSHQKLSSSTSISSVNKDWEHWVPLQGGFEAAAADASRIGGLIDVKYSGDTNNRFN